MTTISGKVIYPQSDFVVLRNFETLVDTIPLDEGGRFSVTYKDFESGFILFTHAPEYQSIYVNKGDSLRLRVNTKAFDESLAFAGSRAAENNFLLDLFIKTEKQDRKLLEKYKASPMDFYKSLIANQERLIKELKEVAKEKEFDPEFVDQSITSIKLNSYSRLERYPFSHFGKSDILESQNLPDAFTKHRNTIDLNDPDLLTLYSYRPYVNSLISHLALINRAKKEGRGSTVDRNGYDYTREKLSIIDSLIHNRTIKELFAGNVTRNFIRKSDDGKEINKLVGIFTDLSKNDPLNSQIIALADTYEDLIPGNKLDNLKLSDAGNQVLKLAERIDKISVLFFWSEQFPDYAMRVHSKVRELSEKYPEIDFIGINVDDKNQETWKKVNSKYRFDLSSEYQLKNPKAVAGYLDIKNKNRTLIIEDDLTVINPDLNLFNYKIETTLLGYLNR
ncbi:MAG: hypothetical protein WBG46_06540 [Nonlabens sp.]